MIRKLMDLPLRIYNRVPIDSSASTVCNRVFDYAGMKKDDVIVTRAAKFLSEVVKTDQPEVFSESLRSLLTVAGGDACWLTIRVTKPTDIWKIPRWHRDGWMFPGGKSIKFAVTLLGPPTLLIEETELVSRTVRINNDDRSGIALALRDEPRIPLETGQIFSFTCGEKNSPVHSEPDMPTDRIFVSVVPGSEQQVRDLANVRSFKFEGLTDFTE